jgi:hypothetical protein
LLPRLFRRRVWFGAAIADSLDQALGLILGVAALSSEITDLMTFATGDLGDRRYLFSTCRQHLASPGR